MSEPLISLPLEYEKEMPIPIIRRYVKSNGYASKEKRAYTNMLLENKIFNRGRIKHFTTTRLSIKRLQDFIF